MCKSERAHIERKSRSQKKLQSALCVYLYTVSMPQYTTTRYLYSSLKWNMQQAASHSNIHVCLCGLWNVKAVGARSSSATLCQDTAHIQHTTYSKLYTIFLRIIKSYKAFVAGRRAFSPGTKTFNLFKHGRMLKRVICSRHGYMLYLCTNSKRPLMF